MIVNRVIYLLWDISTTNLFIDFITDPKDFYTFTINNQVNMS